MNLDLLHCLLITLEKQNEKAYIEKVLNNNPTSQCAILDRVAMIFPMKHKTLICIQQLHTHQTLASNNQT